jgi:Tfp pilus assembly protein PilN
MLVAAVSLVMLVYLVGESRAATTRANAEEADVQKLKLKEKQLRAMAIEVDRTMPNDQRRLLLASHQLVDRKNFSWSSLFEDLESMLPSEAKVTAIAIRDVKQAEGRTIADLELSLMSKSYVDITGMIATMDRSGVFQSELVDQNRLKGDQKDQTEWTLHIIYYQRSGVPVTSTAGLPQADTVAALDGHAGGRR